MTKRRDFLRREGRARRGRELRLSLPTRLGAFAGELILALEEPVKPVQVREIVQRFIQERFRNLDTTEQPERIKQTLPLEYLGNVPIVLESQI